MLPRERTELPEAGSDSTGSGKETPDWALIHLKKWAKQVGIHYHTARKLMKDGKLQTVKIGAQDFLSLQEVKRIAREGTG